MNRRSLNPEWRACVPDYAQREAQRKAKQQRDCLVLILFALAFILFVIFVPRPSRSIRTGRADVDTPGIAPLSSNAGGFFTDRILSTKEVNR